MHKCLIITRNFAQHSSLKRFKALDFLILIKDLADQLVIESQLVFKSNTQNLKRILMNLCRLDESINTRISLLDLTDSISVT